MQIPGMSRTPQPHSGSAGPQQMPDTEKSEQTTETEEAGLPAVLFADLVGSTMLYEALGDSAAKRLIDEALSALASIASNHGGRRIKTIGDEIMCLFPSAERGFHAATSMQGKIDSLPKVGGTKRHIRIGFHAGPVIEEGGDVFGDTVNVAARLSSLAKGMQIMTTRATVDVLPTHLRVLTRNIATVSIKGKSDDMTVCEVLWQQEGGLTMMLSPGANRRMAAAAGAQLRLKHGTRELTLDTKHPSMTMGRDPTNDIVISDIKASRNHARIEKRRDKFFLADHSTNGTMVRIKGEPVIMLRREEIMLRGNGHILFGENDTGEGVESIEFNVCS